MPGAPLPFGRLLRRPCRHGERVLVKFDTGEEKGVERVILINHLENHSENDRVTKEREKEEIAKIKRRKMVIDSSQLDGLEDEDAGQAADTSKEATKEEKASAKKDEPKDKAAVASSKTAKKKKKKKNKKKKK